MLAPMEGIADNLFRMLCHKYGADLTFTGIARVSNLARQKQGELEKILILNTTPTQIQLAGAKISEYEKFLAGFKPTKGFRGFNLNIRFSEEPLSLMRETLHNVQGMKAHSEIQFSLDSENLKDCCP